MSKINSLMKVLTSPLARFYFLSAKGFYNHMPEEKYLHRLYKLKVGKELNLDSPRSFTEKIQWLKLYDRNPQYTVMQDKLLVRDFVSERIGSEYLIPLIGAWDHAAEINFSDFPDQFVLKCNHDCASVMICRDKQTFDCEKAKQKLEHCLQTDYARSGKEWAYKDIPHKIVAEQYMQEGTSDTLTDYKFYCFNGKVKMVMVISGAAHSAERKHVMYDMNFEKLPVYKKTDTNPCADFEKPYCFEKVAALAEKISAEIPFVRVDFYIIDNHPYFGEVAFYPDGGFLEFYPHEWEERIGDWIELPQREN